MDRLSTGRRIGGGIVSGVAVPYASGVETARRVRVFGSDGAFLRSVDYGQANALTTRGLAEWRNGDLRLIALAGAPMAKHLDGLKPTDEEGADNPRGVWSFRRRAIPI